MSLSKKPIPAQHLKTANDALSKNKQEKVYITEDGHLYLPKFKSLLDYHCQTNSKTYWEVAPEEVEAPAAPKAEEKKEEKAASKEEGGKSTLTDEEQKKITESAGAAGAPEPALIEKLKGLSLDKLSAKTKDELKGYAADLKVEVADEDTKPVIAEAILKVVNA